VQGRVAVAAEASPGRGNELTRIVIVDDHALAREGLLDMLADEPGIEVVGEASNGQEALLQCSRLRPDLVFMDVRMPKMDGLTATWEIKQRYPGIIVMIMTMHENPDYLLEALKAGAAGYVLKDALPEEVVEAVWRVRNGDSPLAPTLAARLLRRLAIEGDRRRGTRSPREGPRVEPLTSRELEVLNLMRLGHTNRRISEILWISSGTAKNHVEHIIGKLGVSDRTQAVVRALELGLLELSEESRFPPSA
jgi:DNA-binding NarL/FixJ family response regulator